GWHHRGAGGYPPQRAGIAEGGAGETARPDQKIPPAHSSLRLLSHVVLHQGGSDVRVSREATRTRAAGTKAMTGSLRGTPPRQRAWRPRRSRATRSPPAN